jgi:RNA polymerase sigma-70 factor (ECF subfamily)
MGTPHDLYERYAADVYRFALYLSGNPAEAEDITADTFVRLWTASGDIRLPTVKAYLFTIARHLHADRRKAQARFTELDAALASTERSAEARLTSRSELDAVRRAMRGLSDGDREALLMRTGGLPYDEIAPALGISVTAAKVRVHRARRRLLAASATKEHTI